MEVVNRDGYKDLVYIGNKTIEPGEIFYELSGKVRKNPTRTSIQIGPNQHIEDSYGQYINHHCQANSRIKGNYLEAKKNIIKGDSITFNYNESEDKISNPFICNCCGFYILGKKYT